MTVICIPAEAPEIWVTAAVAGVSLSKRALEKFNTERERGREHDAKISARNIKHI